MKSNKKENPMTVQINREPVVFRRGDQWMLVRAVAVCEDNIIPKRICLVFLCIDCIGLLPIICENFNNPYMTFWKCLFPFYKEIYSLLA